MALTPKSLSFTDSNFWTKIRNSTAGKKVGYFRASFSTGGFAYIVAMCDDVRMVPFVRTAEELFETTALRESTANNFSVVINGPTYGLTVSGNIDAAFGSDAIPAAETLPEGNIVYKNTVLAGSKSDMYYIANNPSQLPRYVFGRGAAPTNVEAALGNMGPLIINKLPFGAKNAFTPPQAGARTTGQPDPKNLPFLTQRSNARYGVMVGLANSSGKVVIGHSLYYRSTLIILQPEGNIGLSITGLRDLLIGTGLDSAVYLDGSTSVMLMLDNQFIVRASSDKNETNVVGIGFKY